MPLHVPVSDMVADALMAHLLEQPIEQYRRVAATNGGANTTPGQVAGGVDPVWWTPFDFEKEVPSMPKSHRPYAPEFRRQMVDLVRSGRTPEALSREFEPTAQAIWNWVRQADRDDGRRQDDPTSAEREELTRLRRENRQLRQERDIASSGS